MTQYPPEGIAVWAWEAADATAKNGAEFGSEAWTDLLCSTAMNEAVGLAFNPPDDDVAAESILVDAIERAALLIESLPCQCDGQPPDEYGDVMPCERCQVLGRDHDERIER